MKTKRYRTYSTSSSDDEALIVLKQATEDPNSYHSLRKDYWAQCEFCDDVFSNRYALFRHNITHMIIPLIKHTALRCKDCHLHFTSSDNLDSHRFKHHNILKIIPNESINLKGEIPNILKSIVEKQVLVKCEDDFNVFVNTNLIKKEVSHNTRDISYTESQNDESITKMTESTNSDTKNNKNSDVGKKKSNIIKEEPLSPLFVKERVSSPIDDEKESIRHRLLFEEDIEDTLFRDLSNECHVNIETLCQEVSLDFDNAIEVSDSDDTDTNHITVNCGTGNNSDHGMYSFEGGINKLENGTNYSGNGTSFEKVRSNYEIKYIDNETNSFKAESDEDNLENVNYSDEVNNPENGIGDFNYGMNDSEHGNHSNSSSIVNVNGNLADEVQSAEIQFKKAIHYNVLMVPHIWVCKFCGTEFPNRFLLHQHETKHLQIKKKRIWTIPLCCVCERYIAGNHHNLRSHTLQAHPEIAHLDITYTTHRCSKCNLRYYNYSKHLKYHHEAFRCEICSLGFETLKLLNIHQCRGYISNSPEIFRNEEIRENFGSNYALMQLCELCFSFMKIYMQNRQNYEEVGTKTELGVRQRCDKCDKEFFSVKLVRRRMLKWRSDDRVASDGLKASDCGQTTSGVRMVSNGLKASNSGQKSSGFGRKTSDFGQKTSDISRKTSEILNKSKMKSKAMTNTERLLKIRNRLKMMKMINKC